MSFEQNVSHGWSSTLSRSWEIPPTMRPSTCSIVEEDCDWIRTEQFGSFADLAGIEHERVRLWTFARAAAEPRDNWSNNDLVSLARSIAP